MLRLLKRNRKTGPRVGFGQGVRDVENLVATAGQLVADRGGIDLRARHFELGESHQYVHARIRSTGGQSHPPEGIKPGSTRPCNRPRLRPQSELVIADAAQLGEIRLGEALVATLR